MELDRVSSGFFFLTFSFKISCDEFDAKTEEFLQKLVSKIYASLDWVAGEIFYLCLSEHNNSSKDATYAIELSKSGLGEAKELGFVSNPEEGLQLFETTAVQYYSAIRRRKKRYLDNYSGHIAIKLVMYGDTDTERTCASIPTCCNRSISSG